MSVGGEVQLCTSKAWVFQPILPNLTFASVTAFTPCTLSHNLRPFRSISINRRRDADFGAHLLQRRPSSAEPLGSKTCCPSHDNELNGFVSCFRHTSCVRRLSLEVSAQGAHTELPCSASCRAHATRPLRVFRNASCWAHTMRLAELPVKLCQSPTPFPLPSKAWQSPSARLWEETGVRPGNRSNRREPERSVQEPKQSDEEPRVRVGEPLPSESEGPAAPESEDIRTRIGRQPHQNRKTSRT